MLELKLPVLTFLFEIQLSSSETQSMYSTTKAGCIHTDKSYTCGDAIEPSWNHCSFLMKKIVWFYGSDHNNKILSPVIFFKRKSNNYWAFQGLNHFTAYKWQASTFSVWYHPWI